MLIRKGLVEAGSPIISPAAANPQGRRQDRQGDGCGVATAERLTAPALWRQWPAADPEPMFYRTSTGVKVAGRLSRMATQVWRPGISRETVRLSARAFGLLAASPGAKPAGESSPSYRRRRGRHTPLGRGVLCRSQAEREADRHDLRYRQRFHAWGRRCPP